MVDEHPDGDGADPTVEDRGAARTPHGSTGYKVLGTDTLLDGVGVLGHNTAASGASHGVQGVTDSTATLAAGVRAVASGSAKGVYGTAGGGPAVFGDSEAGYGGKFTTTSGSSGLLAINDTKSTPSNTGAECITYSAGSNSAGVLGSARASSGTTFGVEGQTRSAESGATGVYGDATAGSGVTVGVRGTTASPDGFGLATPDDAKIEGVVDTNATDFVVEAGTTSTGDARSVVQGHASNEASGTGATVSGGGYDDTSTTIPNKAAGIYSTIGGGRQNSTSGNFTVVAGGRKNDAPGYNGAILGGNNNTVARYGVVGGGFANTTHTEFGTIGGGQSNDVYDDFGVVGGGENNQAGSNDSTSNAVYATVGGGKDNDATGYRATIAGGGNNVATGEDAAVGGGNLQEATGASATVPGGVSNIASGLVSFAAGSDAKAADDNAFVWNDGYSYHADGLNSSKNVGGSGVTGARTFHVSAHGGIRFITGADTVTYISGGSAGWSTASSRAVKTNVDAFAPDAALDGVESLDVCTWEYEADDGDGAGITHIGPMAEDFHDAFDVGDSDQHINAVNADGVAFAAIQGVSEKVDDRTDALREELAARGDRIETLERENEQLRDRLAALERRVDAMADERSTTPAEDD